MSMVLWPFFGGGPMGKAPIELAGGDGVALHAVACHPQQEMVAGGFADGLVVLADIASAGPAGRRPRARRGLGAGLEPGRHASGDRHGDRLRRAGRFQQEVRAMDERTLATDTASLYERDFFAWCMAQAEALRGAGTGGAMVLDYENLAEEIESLGKSERRELASRLGNILEHLVKLQHSPAVEPRAGWVATVRRERRDVELLLEDSPSLERELPALIKRETMRAVRDTVREMSERGGIGKALAATVAAECGSYTVEQVVGDWFPGLESPAV